MYSVSNYVPTSLGDVRDFLVGVDARMIGLAGLEEQREGAGLLALLCSLAGFWIAWKVLLRCQLGLKLRRLSRTVPSVK